MNTVDELKRLRDTIDERIAELEKLPQSDAPTPYPVIDWPYKSKWATSGTIVYDPPKGTWITVMY